ncbi:neuron navigator 1 isoform X1 [Lepisosteus oculatus]|uniref:neuron navigator 1 isoform X1 n=1 Tax=Lepisosteus oculatus TaxID=7918 RepID=UPI00371D96D4
MSGSVNLKIAPRTQQGSGIPLPRSLITSSKPVDKNQGTGGTRQMKQLPVSAKGTTSSKELLRGSTLRSWERNQLLFQNTGMSRACSSSKASYAFERDNGTRSAFSSPRISRKEAPRSKDTLDVNKSSLAFDAFRDQKQNRNKVTQQGNSGFSQNANEDLRENKSCTREDSALSPCTAKERVPATFSNDNSLPNLAPTRTNSIRTDKGHLDFSVPGGLGSFSDEEMGTPEDSSPTKQEQPVSPSVSVQGDSAIMLPKGNQPSQVNMAAVAPFRYRLQIEDNDVSSLEDFSDCSSDSMELSCQSIGGMLGASVKGNEVDIKTDLEESAKAYVQPEGKGTSMASKRGKTGAPQGSSRAELRVFRAGSSEGRLPVSSNLRKQKSLTNLSVLTDTEKKMHLYEPKWCDDMAKPGAGYVKGSKSKEGSGGAPLTRNLSKSEHSLFQGKLAPGTPTGPPKPFSPLAAPSNLGKPSRIPRGPYAEVKPISKAPEAAEDSKSDDEILSSKAKANNKKQAGTPGAPTGKGHGDEENKPYLKVDPELVVTVLGDLEQLLFSQMLDPESQRKRTVQNVLDLRQNLEDTMSSLRGSQLSHSCLENSVCYDSDETNPRSVSSMSNRSSPLSWRYGQSSPRLQAGDAPSSAGGYHSQSTQYASHTMPMRSPSRLSHISRIELIESLDPDDSDLKSGYMSDSDILSKSLHDDDDDDLANGWDESSSISSGLSDASDNLSSEEFNASSSLNSLPTTPIGSRRNSAIVLRTDAEKRSLVESGLSWYSEDGKPHRKMDISSGYDTGSLKTESSSKWRKVRPETSSEEMAKGELKKPQSLGQPNVLRKGKNPPVGVTSPITHTSQSMLKVAAPKSDQKAVDKAKMAVKASGLQRSCSDAGKDRGESRKPPSGLARPSAGTSFGYKKPPLATGTATVMTAGGTTISSGSATVGKTPKTSGIPVKPMSGGGGGGGGSGGRKTSLDVSNCTEGFLSPNARTNIQYRSLPRPAKSSAMSLTGRASSRPVSSSIDASLLSLKPSGGSSRLKEPGITKSSGRASMGPVNQTDREKEKAKAKAVASDSECGPMKSGPPAPQTPQEPSSKLQGLRQSSGSKFSELSSPTTHRVLSSKSLGKPPCLAHLDKVNSNSLDSGMSAQDHPPTVTTFSKMQEKQGSGSPCLTPSPAPVLNINSTSCFSDQALSLSSSPLLYPKLSGLHRSMESLPLHMSVPSGTSFSETDSRDKEEDRSATGWSGSTRASLTESSQRDRNTLPKKGLSSRYNSCQPEEDSKERRHSHTIVSLTESECALQLPSPSSVSLSSTGKAPFTNVVSPSPTSAPRMTRSNSIPTHDAAFELYGGSQMGSTLSLADRPKGMIRSGSFRDPVDDVHGSVLSLASSASSNYSSAEERMQGEQIRKLRRELESSQEKVANLTTQLSANANLVAAFEQSLAFMTSRLQSLSVSAEQKDTELVDLRETIEMLKTKNSEAQAVIHGALNNPDITPKELRIKRQNSSESISSLNSITSHSSIGSCKDADAKKKKKKSWLRTSFNKAFSIKKGPKSATSYSDIEEIATPDSSAPSSPKLVHEGAENTALSLTSSTSTSSSVIFEGNEEPENEEKVVSELRSELWEKEMKLTDIRLEALSSAHQLEQLREAMNNMQMTVENLKAENDQLKTGTTAPSSAPPSSISQPQSLTTLLTSSSPRQSMAMSLTQSFSLSLSECNEPDLSPMDAMSTSSQKDEHRLRVVVCVPDLQIFKDDVKQQDFFIGSVKINAKTDWTMLDKAVIQAFKDYIIVVDPASSLGLSVDSIYSYSINNGKRILGTETPEVLPSRCMSKGVNNISVTLKGLKEKCVDSLVFETLIPKPMMQHYISLLLKHRRLILSGPSGTGKTYLTSRLAEYLVDRSGREVTGGITVTYNMHQQSCKDLQLYLSNLANQIDRETSSGDVPLVIILDDLSDACSISELVNGALTCKYHKCPYIIGTTNQPVKMTPNHGLHLSFRMVTFSNNVEPANGFLVRYLHRKLMESENESSICSEELMRVLDWVPKLWYHLHTFLEKHSTSDFLIGPCFFLSCPVTVEEFRSWFIDLWNHSIIPYLQEGAKDGIKVHGHKAVWEDPVEWVRGTLPWPSAQQDQAKLFHLPPPSVGPVSTGQVAEERVSKETTPSSLESDPLMAMLLKLQEAANYIESPDRETAVEPNLQSTL